MEEGAAAAAAEAAARHRPCRPLRRPCHAPRAAEAVANEAVVGSHGCKSRNRPVGPADLSAAGSANSVRPKVVRENSTWLGLGLDGGGGDSGGGEGSGSEKVALMARMDQRTHKYAAIKGVYATIRSPSVSLGEVV